MFHVIKLQKIRDALLLLKNSRLWEILNFSIGSSKLSFLHNMKLRASHDE